MFTRPRFVRDDLDGQPWNNEWSPAMAFPPGAGGEGERPSRDLVIGLCLCRNPACPQGGAPSGRVCS